MRPPERWTHKKGERAMKANVTPEEIRAARGGTSDEEMDRICAELGRDRWQGETERPRFIVTQSRGGDFEVVYATNSREAAEARATLDEGYPHVNYETGVHALFEPRFCGLFMRAS
jgi:hypothetical protein